MKIVAIICNAVLFLFTCMVMVTDGLPGNTTYILINILVLLIPVLNGVVLLKGSKHISRITKIVSVAWNIVLFGSICWAFADQYPHPREEGIVLYTVMMLITPVLSAVVLYYMGTSKSRP